MATVGSILTMAGLHLDLFSWANGVMLAGSLLGVVIYLIWSPEGLHREGFSSPSNINLPPHIGLGIMLDWIEWKRG